MGDAFLNVQGDPDSNDLNSYRRYFCEGLTRGAKIEGSIKGKFEVGSGIGGEPVG